MEKEALPYEFRHDEGDPVSVLAAHGRFVDLVVVSQPDRETTFPMLAHELAIVAGRPLLVVPRFVAPTTIGANVLVAWNGGREAARAIGDAMPLLVRAGQVQVMTISASADRATEDATSAADMAAHLARHGVKAEARNAVAADIDVANLVLSAAADLGSDLLVMGAYGHSRLREIVLGGATRGILQSLTVPVLLSH
jgi:nucleotide-binding universal stress UspA family protein